jgi:tetratricopeptide (TPR) repeat protein
VALPAAAISRDGFIDIMKWLKRLLGSADIAASEKATQTTAGDDSRSLAGCLGVDGAADLERLLEAGDSAAAEELLAKVLPLHPGQPVLLLKQATCWRLRGELARAKSACDELLSSDCEAAAVHLELAMCCSAEHDLPTAIEHLEVAVRHDPASGIAWFRLGQILMRLNQPREAHEPFRKATERVDEKHAAQAWYLLGETERLQRNLPAAQSAYEACLARDPKHLECLTALGHTHLLTEDELRALTCYESVMAASQQVPASLRLNVGAIHQHLAHFDEAHAILSNLVSERPGDHVARWYLCQLDLLQGRWSEGWANYRARFASGASPYRPMPYQPWAGQPLADEPLLVLADEGLGDEIMFASCLPDLRSRVAHCIVECEPRLRRLFERSFPDIHFVATQRENSTNWLAGLPEPRMQVCAGDLPAYFRASDAAFPKHDGYLQADPERVAYWRARLRETLGDKPAIGISWRGGAVGTRTRARSIDSADWAPILAVPDVGFVNLQYGQYQSERARLESEHGVAIHDFPEAIADYDETAALVAALDLVVTVCTAVVHLTGALGKPAWILTPLSPGWRYTADRTSMPWYPSTRIFRQEAFGDWGHPCREVSRGLHQLTNCVSTSTP